MKVKSFAVQLAVGKSSYQKLIKSELNFTESFVIYKDVKASIQKGFGEDEMSSTQVEKESMRLFIYSQEKNLNQNGDHFTFFTWYQLIDTIKRSKSKKYQTHVLLPSRN